MSTILETRGLTHVYGAGTPFERTALDHVDLKIQKGEILGVIGHTGSGKSTLIQHFNGLLKPSEGEVLLDGQSIWNAKGKCARETRFRVGLVFQYPEYQLFEETIARDIAFGPTNMGLPQAEIDERVLESMRAVGLDRKKLSRLLLLSNVAPCLQGAAGGILLGIVSVWALAATSDMSVETVLLRTMLPNLIAGIVLLMIMAVVSYLRPRNWILSRPVIDSIENTPF